MSINRSKELLIAVVQASEVPYRDKQEMPFKKSKEFQDLSKLIVNVSNVLPNKEYLDPQYALKTSEASSTAYRMLLNKLKIGLSDTWKKLKHNITLIKWQRIKGSLIYYQSARSEKVSFKNGGRKSLTNKKSILLTLFAVTSLVTAIQVPKVLFREL